MGHKLTYNDTAHSYYLNGRRCKSVTAVAKIAPDSYALEQWRKRQVAIGLTLEPRLVERVAVDPDNREAVDGVCEDAMRAAGAHHAADRGTQRHRASEIFDTDGQLLTAQQRADAQAWQRTIEQHGVEILPEYVEGFAVWPDHAVSGRFDRIARWRGRSVILDLKSGENAVKYPQGTAVQLALYARAPMISASVSTTGDKTTITDWRQPPADLDLSTALVVLLNDELDIGELYEIDIQHGWTGAQLALDLVDWRKGHNYGRDLARNAGGQRQAVELLSRELGAEEVPLVEQLAKARAVADLEQLWKSNRGQWEPEHTEAAKKRKHELGVLARLARTTPKGRKTA